MKIAIRNDGLPGLAWTYSSNIICRSTQDSRTTLSTLYGGRYRYISTRSHVCIIAVKVLVKRILFSSGKIGDFRTSQHIKAGKGPVFPFTAEDGVNVHVIALKIK